MDAERITGLIVGIGFVSGSLTVWLVAAETMNGATCPPLFGIAACYLVLVGYVTAVAGAWNMGVSWAHPTFLFGATLVTLIGVYFTAGQIAGRLECPSFEGFPMCFGSLAAGLMMLGLDQVRRRSSVVG